MSQPNPTLTSQLNPLRGPDFIKNIKARLAADPNAFGAPTVTKIGRLLESKVHSGAHDRYAAGAAYADWWIATGGDLFADAPWGDEAKCNGFHDRLAEARQRRD